MEEMHSMKKRYEEEKGRSVSFTRNEDLHRLRTLESELEKKEKTVSKLSKEKLELEEENVKMNVQIMKMYSELEKYKSNTHSLKFIPTSTK
jgi:superfamily II DNA/RNA helicase